MVAPGYVGVILTDEGMVPAGTCFQLDGGVIVTAAHVLDDLDLARNDSVVWVRELDPNKPAGAAKVAHVDEAHDLAVLTTDHRFPAMASQLSASDPQDLGHPIRISGVAEIDDPDSSSCSWSFEADGTWQGKTTDQVDRLVWGRVRCQDVSRGMSGAPVRRSCDDAVIGIVSGRYNSVDGWLRDSVWVARTEDLRPLLTGLAELGVSTDLSGGIHPSSCRFSPPTPQPKSPAPPPPGFVALFLAIENSQFSF